METYLQGVMRSEPRHQILTMFCCSDEHFKRELADWAFFFFIIQGIHMLLVSLHLTNVSSVSWHIIRPVKDYISDQTGKTWNLPNLSEQGKVFLFLLCISSECVSPILHKRWWVSVCSASPNLLCNPWAMMNVLRFFWHEDGGWLFS